MRRCRARMTSRWYVNVGGSSAASPFAHTAAFALTCCTPPSQSGVIAAGVVVVEEHDKHERRNLASIAVKE
jgi:hypothetical protein